MHVSSEKWQKIIDCVIGIKSGTVCGALKGPHRLRFCSTVLFDEQVCSNKNDANLKCVPGKSSVLLANKNEENFQVYPDYVRRTCSTDLSIRTNLKCVR
jgi:hypothetical protein